MQVKWLSGLLNISLSPLVSFTCPLPLLFIPAIPDRWILNALFQFIHPFIRSLICPSMFWNRFVCHLEVSCSALRWFESLAAAASIESPAHTASTESPAHPASIESPARLYRLRARSRLPRLRARPRLPRLGARPRLPQSRAQSELPQLRARPILPQLRARCSKLATPPHKGDNKKQISSLGNITKNKSFYNATGDWTFVTINII